MHTCTHDSIKPGLDSGLWTLDSGGLWTPDFFLKIFKWKKKEKIQLFLKKENKMKIQKF